nr:uncharacterized protein CFP56_33456 [Quercus suber]
MVGVPHSRGCLSCRRLKKGCDLKQPACGRCSRLGKSCQYNQRQWTFVASEELPTSSRLSRVIDRSPPALIDQSLLKHAQDSLMGTALDITIRDSFFTRYLPRLESFTTDEISNPMICPIFREMEDLLVQEECARLSLQACALTCVGRLDDNPTLTEQGLRFYLRALRATNRALQTPARAQNDAVLMSCQMLGMYEQFRCGQSENISSKASGWMRHADGACHLIEFRGPDKHITSQGRRAFRLARKNIMVAAVTLKKPISRFGSIAWKTVPYSTYEHNIWDDLIDIMWEIPSLLNIGDELLVGITQQQLAEGRIRILKRGGSYLSQCLEVAERLRSWEEKVLLLAGKRYEQQGRKAPCEPLSTLGVCKDHGYAFFQMIALYWQACVIHYGRIWLIQSKLTCLGCDYETNRSFIPRIPQWISAKESASNICSTISHFFDTEAGLWGIASATFPMGAAFHYFAASGKIMSPEVVEMRKVMMQNSRARVARDILTSMADRASPPRMKHDARVAEKLVAMATAWYDPTATEIAIPLQLDPDL